MSNFLPVKIVLYQDEIAAIKNIRTQVFQKEQGIAAELEFDGLDETAIHLLAYLNGEAVGTTRMREIDNHTSKIERLAVLPVARKQGVGRKLMIAALEAIAQQNKSLAIVHAQAYIASLYQQLGFEIVGEEFSEAGITHVKMIKQLS
jgi:predicted GNAT family N-acyltransferase